MKFRISALAFALLLLCGSFAMAQEEEIVRLRFDWPDDLVVHVEQQWSKIKSVPGRVDSVGVRSTYRMLAFDHRDGRLIRTDSFLLPDIKPETATESQRMLSSLMQQFPAFYPDYIVDAEGNFVRSENLARTRAVFDSIFGLSLRDFKSNPQMKAFFDTLLSANSLNSIRQQEWDAMVGNWASADLEIGATYEFALEQPIPALSGLTVPAKLQIILTGRTPCRAGDSTHDCVEIQSTTRLDSAGVIRLLRSIADKVGADKAEEFGSSLRQMSIESRVTIVTDPRTLLPYKLVSTKSSQATADKTATEEGGTYYQEETRSYRYWYD